MDQPYGQATRCGSIAAAGYDTRHPPGAAELGDERPLFMKGIHDALPVKKYSDALKS